MKRYPWFLASAALAGAILPVVFWIVAAPGYTNLIVDMVFTDLLPCAALTAFALWTRSRVLAAVSAVMTVLYLLIKIGTIVLYDESFLPLSFDTLVLLWEHTDHEGVKAMVGEYYYCIAPVCAAVIAAGTVFCCRDAMDFVRRADDAKRTRILVCVFCYLLLSLIANARYVWYREVNTVYEENYTGHIICPLTRTFGEIIEDGTAALMPDRRKGKRGFENHVISPESEKFLTEKGLLADKNKLPNALPRFDRIVMVAIESLDGDFISSVNPEMPPDLTPNIDRLKREYCSFSNCYSAAQPTSWGLNALLLSRPGYKLDKALQNDSICDIFRKHGIRSIYLSPVGGEFGDNKKHFGRMFRFDTMLFEEELRRRYDYATGSGGWGLSDESMYRIAMEYLKTEKPDRFFLLVSTMDTHHPYHASGPTAGQHKFGDAFLDAVHGADDNAGRFVRDFTADPELFNDRTLLIVTADHSASHGKNRTRRKILTDPARIPLIFITKRPLILPQETKDRIFSTIDLPATFARMLGEQIPDTFMGQDITTKNSFAIARDVTEKIWLFLPGQTPCTFSRLRPRLRTGSERALYEFYNRYYRLENPEK